MDNNFNWNFDANTVAPKQSGGAHPVGNKFPFKITAVEVKATKNNDGGMLNVELTSPAGSITNRYGLWNANEMTRQIAQGQLSALCHAVGIFQIGPRKGQELIGGQGMMDVGFQKGHEPSAEKPEGGYVEVKKVYTAAGLEPGAGNAVAPQGTPMSGGQANTQGNGGQSPNNGQTAPNTASPSNNAPAQWGNAAPAAEPQQQNNAGWNGGSAPATSSPPWNS